jgi:hypothetical protein
MKRETFIEGSAKRAQNIDTLPPSNHKMNLMEVNVNEISNQSNSKQVGRRREPPEDPVSQGH